VYTPHLLRHSWRLPETEIHFADVDEVPIECLDSNPLSPYRGVSVAMIRWCGIGEEDDNEKMWEVLRITNLASSQNGISTSQPARSTQDESCYVWLQATRVSHRSGIGSKSV